MMVWIFVWKNWCSRMTTMSASENTMDGDVQVKTPAPIPVPEQAQPVEEGAVSKEAEEETLERVLLHDERSCIFETRVERAALCRDRGSLQFKQKNIHGAIEWYERALFHVDFDEGTWHFEFMDKHRDAVNEVRLPVHLNLAMCYLNDTTQDLAKVIEQADAALVIDPKNAKALYRGGRAHLMNNNLDEARKKLKLAALSQPNDKNIREALQLLVDKTAKHRAKEKETWGGRLLESKMDDEDDADENATDSVSSPLQGNQQTSSSSSSSSWYTPLVVLLVAILAGLVLIMLK